jgi:hypothetical protein
MKSKLVGDRTANEILMVGDRVANQTLIGGRHTNWWETEQLMKS